MGTIKVVGKSHITAQPDYVSVNISVKTKIHEKLQNSNDAALTAILKVKEVCKSKNIDMKDLKIINFTHNNIYKTVEKEVKDPYWSQNKETSREQIFVGYQTSAGLKFGFDFDMKEIAEMFELLSSIEDITYKMNYAVKDSEKYEKRCQTEAVKDGLATASLIAQAANTTLKEIIEISHEENHSRNIGISYEAASFKRSSMASAIEDLGVSDIYFSDEVYITVQI